VDLKHRNDEEWINLAQNREMWRNVVNTVLNLRVSKNSGPLLPSYAAVSFSSTTILQAIRMTRLRGGRPAILGSFPGWGRDVASSSCQLAVGRSVRLQHSVRIRWQKVTALRMCGGRPPLPHTRLHYSYCKRKLLPPSLCFYTPSTLTIEGTNSSETTVLSYPTVRRHIADNAAISLRVSHSVSGS